VVRFARSGVVVAIVIEMKLRESAIAVAALSFEVFAQGAALIEL
jgi:hypothetical protein